MNRRRSEPDIELLADIATARRVRQEIVAQRRSLAKVISFLAQRRVANNFGSELQVTFRPQSSHRSPDA